MVNLKLTWTILHTQRPKRVASLGVSYPSHVFLVVNIHVGTEVVALTLVVEVPASLKTLRKHAYLLTHFHCHFSTVNFRAVKIIFFFLFSLTSLSIPTPDTAVR